MRNGIFFSVSSGDRQRLQAIVVGPKSPQKHVWRARIVLLSGDGLGTSAIMAETGKSKTCVWRWQERFMHEGVDGLLRGLVELPKPTIAQVQGKVIAGGLMLMWVCDLVVASDDAQFKFVNDFVAAWTKVMNLDRF